MFSYGWKDEGDDVLYARIGFKMNNCRMFNNNE